MKLHELKPAEGSRHKKKRLGRGPGSGLGKTCGKGHKGQKARTGGGVRPGFEGGQRPLYLRLPKRGFTNRSRKEYSIVNLETLNQFPDGTEITPDFLLDAGVIKNLKAGLKILGDGKINKSLTVRAHKFSGSAENKINSAGGTAEVI